MAEDKQIPPVPPTPPVENKKQRDPIYITIILLLLIGAGLMYWEMDRRGSELEKCTGEKAGLNDDLNYVISELGSDPEKFKQDLDAMLNQVDTLIAINSELGEDKALLMDSLLRQKEKIEEMQEELKRGRWTAVELRKKEKELAVLRGVMQTYVHRIDSLISENDILRNRLTTTETQLTEATQTIDKYVERTDKLEETVAAGQVLKTTELVATGIRLKSSGDQRETNRARRTNRIKACFTIMENRIAKANTKTLYMRVIGPKGAVLAPSQDQTFKMGDGEGIFSVTRDVEYTNQDLPVCIYYIMTEEAEEGTYIVEIWAEGHKIGKTTLDLK